MPITGRVRKVELNDFLNRENPWTRRLLGLEPYKRTRDADLVDREYDRDLYGKLLEEYGDDPEAFRRALALPSSEEVVVAVGPEIVSMSLAEFRSLRASTYCGVLDRIGAGSALCELGAGYGQNALALDRDLYGGEYSQAAVDLAGRMGFDIVPFDFYDPASYDFIRPSSVVMTAHAVEQIPDARFLIEGLRRVRNRVRVVVNFEPMHRTTPVTLLDHIRNRYLELNDYCRNLIEATDSDPEIEVLEHTPDVLGLNPLNPTSIRIWRFR